MKMPYLQRKFSKSTKKHLSSFFGFSPDEGFLCGIWTSPFFRHGFVITDKALYWYFKTSDGIKTGKITKDSASNITFEITPQISSENSVASLANSIAEECSKLEIRTGERSETFYITGLTEEKGKILCDILKFAFTQNALPQIDLGKLVKKAVFSPLTTFLDMILNLINKIAQKIINFKNYLIQGFHELTHINFKFKKKSKSTQTNNFSTKEHNSAISFLLNYLDILASLLFVANIVIILQPQLITKHGFSINQLTPISLSGYTFLKCIITFYSKKGIKKILSFILIVISILTYFLFSYSLTTDNIPKFFVAIFLILCLLSYLAFEYSCGYKTMICTRK
jgi:hypothetical protein